VLWLAVLATFLFICWKAIPVKLSSAELYDFMEDQAGVSSRTPEETIHKRLLKRGRELNLPLTKNGVKVERSRGRIRMQCTYTVPLEFPGYTYHWDFDQVVDRPVFDY